MSAKLTSGLLLLALALSLGLLGKLGYSNYQLSKAKDYISSELMSAKLEVGRAHTELGDAQARIGSLSSDLQSEVKQLKATVTRYAELEAQYNVLKKIKNNTAITYYNDGTVFAVTCPEEAFVRGILYEAIEDRVLNPISELKATIKDERINITCKISPYPNIKRDIPFQIAYNLHMKIRGQLIETRTSGGTVNHFLELKEVDSTGKELGSLELTSFEVIVHDETLPHFIWWAPHVDVGILAGINMGHHIVTGGSIGLSPFGFGRTINDLTWRFPQVSMDLATSAGIGISPFLYNIGAPLPLVSNIWIGPHLMWGFSQDALLGLFAGGVL